jgi:predicted LPLAT superfamily acyltransferase
MSEWSGKSKGNALGYSIFIFIIKRLGIAFSYFFLVFVATHFVLFARKETQAIVFYSRKILKKGRFNTFLFLFKNFYTFGQTIIDKIAIRGGLSEKYKFEFNNYKEFLSVLDSQQGVIMLGAHIGCWEVGAPFFDDYAKKINVVMYDGEYQNIKHIIEENNGEGDSFHVIPIKEDDFSHVFKIKDALDANEYVCFQGDRYMGEKNVLETTFMGQEAKFPLGPFLLASKFNVPVVSYFAMRERNKTYRFNFIIHPNKGKQRPEEILNEYVKNLEDIVKRYPEQWFNYYKFWKE